MQIPQGVARFNRVVTNPIQRLWAGRAPTFGILEHVGRMRPLSERLPFEQAVLLPRPDRR